MQGAVRLRDGRVLSYSIYGAIKSLAGTSQGYSFRSVAEDVNDLMDQLGVQKAVIMGTSGGGPYACCFAALYPARVQALALVASMTHTCGPASAQLLRGMDWGNRLGYNLINYLPGPTHLSLRMAGAPLSYLFRLSGIASSAADAQPPAAAAAAATTATIASAATAPVEAEQQGTAKSLGMAAADAGPFLSASSSAATGGVPASSHSHPTAEQPGPSTTSEHKDSKHRGLPYSILTAAISASGFAQPDADAMLQHPQVFATLTKMVAEVFRQGGEGLWQDMRLTSQPWHEFQLSDIQAPAPIFQGDMDVNVTVEMAKYLAEQIPRSKLRLFPGEGHMSLAMRHMPDILADVRHALSSHDRCILY